MTSRHITLRSRLSDIDRASALVVSFADEAGLSPRTRLALTLVLEELISNSVMHGEAHPDTAITIDLRLGVESVWLRYEDGGRPFDPLLEMAPDDRDRVAEERRVGGLGWPLIRAWCRDLAYSRVGARNRLELLLPLR